jgi:hypothetical protein
MESSPDPLTEESRFFLEPASPAQRQYEALRAYFLEGSPPSRWPSASATPQAPSAFSVTTSAALNPPFFQDLKPGPRT